MRVCANCGKSNLPTRKYCIRCGRSLISAETKHVAPKESKPDIPEVGRTVTAATFKKEPKTEPPTPVDEDEEWVKPSEVSKDRVRSSTTKRQTELEKAQAAFKRAEEVGIDEDTTGIVETRMLRASEVRELMEGVSEMHTPTLPVDESEDDGLVAGPPPIAAPSPRDIESQLLGSMSAYVEHEEIPEVEKPLLNDFTSSRYEEAATGEELTYDLPPEDTSQPVVPPKPEPTSMIQDAAVTTCPSCGEIINVDSFEYPREVYSAMGSARVKQARFFVVQGKYEEAQKVVRIARSLYVKAGDETGLAEVSKLVDSLARRG